MNIPLLVIYVAGTIILILGTLIGLYVAWVFAIFD